MVMDQVVLPFALRLADVEEMLNSSSSTASVSPHTLALLHWQFLEGQKWCCRVMVLVPFHRRGSVACTATGENVVFLFSTQHS